MASINPYSSPAPATPVPAPAPAAKDLPYGCLELTTRIVQGLYLLLLFVSLATALAAFQAKQTLSELNSLERALQSQDWMRPDSRRTAPERHIWLQDDLAAKAHTLELLTGPAVALVALLLMIVAVIWVYRAAANLPALAATDAKQSPWVAALTMAIPFVNSLAALGVMGQIAKGSDPRGFPKSGRSSGEASSIVVWWWFFNLVSIAGGVYVKFILEPAITSGEQLERYIGFVTFLSGYSVIPLGLAIVMFGSIAANQDKRRDKVLGPPATKKTAGNDMGFLHQPGSPR